MGRKSKGYTNEVEDVNVETVITETITDVEDILTDPIKEETIYDEVVEERIVEELNETIEIKTDKIAIRMIAGHKGYRSGDDLLLTKKEIKAIPKLKYKLI